MARFGLPEKSKLQKEEPLKTVCRPSNMMREASLFFKYCQKIYLFCLGATIEGWTSQWVVSLLRLDVHQKSHGIIMRLLVGSKNSLITFFPPLKIQNWTQWNMMQLITDHDDDILSLCVTSFASWWDWEFVEGTSKIATCFTIDPKSSVSKSTMIRCQLNPRIKWQVIVWTTMILTTKGSQQLLCYIAPSSRGSAVRADWIFYSLMHYAL